MANRGKVMITMNPAMLQAVDNMAARHNMNRSEFIEKVMRAVYDCSRNNRMLYNALDDCFYFRSN